MRQAIRLWRRRDGTATLELALVSPLLLVMFAGIVDFGRVYHDKIELSAAVAAASEYALINASSVNSTSAASLAATISGIVANINGSTNGTGWAGATVTVNNGATSTVSNGTTTPSGGPAANADSCYCPAGSSPSWTWGSATTCGTSCAGGTLAGKFVTITGTRAFSPLFLNYHLISAITLQQSTIVQTQ
jgi:Flp pilus assembly protein TadG